MTFRAPPRYYNLQDSNTISFFTVLPSGCSAEGRAAAQLANDPATLLNGSLSAAAAAEAAQLDAMKARLDAVQPLLAALLAEPEPALTIAGLDPANPLVWMGVQGQICFRIPASANTNPKGLVLYLADSTTYYVNVLGAGNSPMPADYQGCSNFSVSKGVAAGKYFIALENSATGSLFVTVGFFADKASLACTAFSYATTFGTVTIAWTMPVARASANDTVWVVNSRGTVVNWFYTSCKCQKAPGALAVPTGSFSFRVFKGTVPGGYVFELHPGGLDPMAALAPNWIPWAKFGW
uniref:Uncharacterized protein n=1 Tax=Cryptomonas curvata TaxID=233186 RepID=A0A7S0MFV9_9CRYP